MAAIHNLVEKIVDYAGLFPPAELALPDVIHNYSQYLNSDYSWMLGRLVVPASRLAELSDLAQSLLPHQPGSAWLISALLPSVNDLNSWQTAVGQIVEFNQRHTSGDQGWASVDSVECRAATGEDVLRIAESLPEDWNAFLELPHDTDPDPLIDFLRQHPRKLYAKIRTGGVTRELIPSPQQVARFIHRCARHQVGFKATAGLHHPIRARYRLTYEDDAPQAMMYGFLNVFAAACFAFGANASTSDLTEILKETEISSFEFGDLSLRWKNLDVTSSNIAEIRFSQAISFGSCSFEEPTTELSSAGLLGDQVNQ